MRATVWEGQKVSNVEALLRLDPSNRMLTFDTSIAKYVSVLTRVMLCLQSYIWRVSARSCV